MKKLLLISNHPPTNWSEEQKKEWDEIVYIPFPNVPPEMSREEVRLLADQICKEIEKITGGYFSDTHYDGYTFWCPVFYGAQNWRICIQGEYTLCAEIFSRFGNCPDRLVFPTTERRVEEIRKEDGSVEKRSVFRFIKWR